MESHVEKEDKPTDADQVAPNSGRTDAKTTGANAVRDLIANSQPDQTPTSDNDNAHPLTGQLGQAQLQAPLADGLDVKSQRLISYGMTV